MLVPQPLRSEEAPAQLLGGHARQPAQEEVQHRWRPADGPAGGGTAVYWERTGPAVGAGPPGRAGRTTRACERGRMAAHDQQTDVQAGGGRPSGDPASLAQEETEGAALSWAALLLQRQRALILQR